MWIRKEAHWNIVNGNPNKNENSFIFNASLALPSIQYRILCVCVFVCDFFWTSAIWAYKTLGIASWRVISIIHLLIYFSPISTKSISFRASQKTEWSVPSPWGKYKLKQKKKKNTFIGARNKAKTFTESNHIHYVHQQRLIKNNNNSNDIKKWILYSVWFSYDDWW